MQGKWASIDDSKSQLKIQERVCIEIYEGFGDSEYYRIYFSDTLVDCMNLNFSQIKIDTTALSGNYILLRDLNNLESFWTRKIYGFYWTKTEKTYSSADTWAKRRPTVVKRISN